MCREVAWELRFDVEKDGEQPETAAFYYNDIIIVRRGEAPMEEAAGDG